MAAVPPGRAAPLSHAEGLARIRLLRSARIGPVTFHQLLRQFGTAEAALAALPELAARGGLGRAGAQNYRPAAQGAIEAEIAATRRAGGRYLFHDSPDYPPLLRLADGAPPVLVARGDVRRAQGAAVALVGARDASGAARFLAREWGQKLAEMGFPVVSGLARGVDAAAHEGALAAATGAGTVAVVAGGVDVAYPPEHADLQARIAAEGLLLSEAPCGTQPTNRHFPARNRIIAGLAAGTVVVEAALRSGSLITARMAAEYGREVMAVPGSPLDARSHGTNTMIREGAILVQRVDDIAELLSHFDGQVHSRFAPERLRAAAAEAELPLAPAQAEAGADLAGRIAALLSPAPLPVDELVRQSGEAAASVQMALIELELAGRLQRHAGGKVSCQP